MNGTSSDGSTVLLVDDHPVVRRGMASLLSSEPWIRRCIEAGSCAEGARLATLESPAAAVVDIGLPDGDGIALIRQIRKAVPGCVVLVLTMTRDEATVRACLEAGASGYLLKDSAPDTLVPSLRTVLEGGVVLGPDVASDVLRQVRRTSPPFDTLTPRELQHVSLLASGLSGSQIARRLAVTEKTARNQMAIILSKLGVTDRVQAALLARDAGLHER